MGAHICSDVRRLTDGQIYRVALVIDAKEVYVRGKTRLKEGGGEKRREGGREGV